MANLDAAALGQQAVRLGLLTEPQLLEARREVGPRNPDPEALLLWLERKGFLTPWQSGKLRRGDGTGFHLGGYRILDMIATGSLSRVYRADDPSTGRMVAIKRLRQHWTEHRDLVDLFLREGRVGMTLKHPAIVEVLATSHDAPTNGHFVVMEFVEGRSLRDILWIRKRFNTAETLRILEDAANALAYAYSHGVSHRNITLERLLMSNTGAVKLFNFRRARLFSASRPDRFADEKVESDLHYARLEKAIGAKGGDVRSDLFFLGCVGYQLLSGRSPLELTRGKSAPIPRARVDNVPRLVPDQLGVLPSVIVLIETMMSLDPLKRYQTPSQVYDAVKHLRRKLAGATGVDSKPE